MRSGTRRGCWRAASGGGAAIRRRAALQGWAKKPAELYGFRNAEGTMQALDYFVELKRKEIDELLLAPSPEGLLAFAFRRATEAAARVRPLEAAHWMRLVDQMRRNLDTMRDLEDEPGLPEVRRAIIAQGLKALHDARAHEPATAGEPA